MGIIQEVQANREAIAVRRETKTGMMMIMISKISMKGVMTIMMKMTTTWKTKIQEEEVHPGEAVRQ